MVGIAAVVSFLYPTAQFPVDCVVALAAGAESIVSWNVAKLGAQPSEVSLAGTQASQPYLDYIAAPAVLQRSKDAARAQAILNYANGPEGMRVLLRAVALVVLDEINILRSAASLAPRTAGQIKTAITNKINAGTADSQ